jgi:hypothetical protein
MKRFTCLVAAFLMLTSLDGPARAQTASSISFDHWATNDTRSYSLPIGVGTFFEVRVLDTCDQFEIGVIAVPAAESATARGGGSYFSDVIKCVIQTEPLTQLVPHASDSIGGYDILITRKDGEPDAVRAVKLKSGVVLNDLIAEFDGKFAMLFPNLVSTPERVTDKQLNDAFGTLAEFGTLKNVRLHVHIAPAEDWVLSFAGGFSLNDLTDPQFAVVGDAGSQIIVRDTSAEDSRQAGLATFIHLTPTKPQWGKKFAVSFGLGLTSDNEPSYYFGPSWRLGAYGYITAGVNWHKISRLPNGQMLGVAPIDANVLNNLKTRMDDGAFVAWSYPFLGKGKAAFEKPFSTIGSTPQAPTAAR